MHTHTFFLLVRSDCMRNNKYGDGVHWNGKFVFPFVQHIRYYDSRFPDRKEPHFICYIKHIWCVCHTKKKIQSERRNHNHWKLRTVIACIKRTHFHHYHSEKVSNLLFNVHIHIFLCVFEKSTVGFSTFVFIKQWNTHL